MAQSRDVNDTTMYFVPVGPTVAFAAYDGYIWIAADDAALEAIIQGDSGGFSDDDDSVAAADLFDNDHVAAGFLSFTGQFGELVISSLDEGDAPGTEGLLRSLHNVSLEVGQNGDVMTADAGMYWDGDAAGSALADAFSIGFRNGIGSTNEESALEVEAAPPEQLRVGMRPGHVPTGQVPPSTPPSNTIAPSSDGKPPGR
jgi:hypothetical protein